MPEIVSCPQCQRQLRIPDELLGRSVKCPSCGTTFTGMAATASAPEPPVYPFAEEPGGRPAPLPPPDAGHPGYEFDDRAAGPYGRGRPFVRRDAAPHRGTLILVLGILSLVICAVTGPIAWILGNNDLAEMRAGRMDREGEGITRAGQICGIIGSVFLVLQCGFGMLYAVLIATVVAKS